MFNDMTNFWQYTLQDSFSDLPSWQEKHVVMNEAGNFLIEVVREPIAAEIKQNLLLVNRRWADVSTGAENFMKAFTAEQLRQEYGVGLQRLLEWLERAEVVMEHRAEVNLADARNHAKALEVRRQLR